MICVCPTVMASNEADYRFQMNQIQSFAKRIHIDVADGIFTPRKLIPLKDVWWPHDYVADIHVMYNEPDKFLDFFESAKPNLVIVHAEAEGDFIQFADRIKNRGIKIGVALLPDTPASVLVRSLNLIDHVLIFSGHLSQFGGKVDLTLLDKVKQLKDTKPEVEIGWDGGISEANARELVQGGVNVLNVGGHIHQAPNPERAYDAILKAANGAN